MLTSVSLSAFRATRRPIRTVATAVIAALTVASAGCREVPPPPAPPTATSPAATAPAATRPTTAPSGLAPCPTGDANTVVASVGPGADLLPCPTGPAAKGGSKDIPRYAENSPFSADYQPPKTKEGKRLWAKSALWAKAPELVVEKWLTDKPQTKGKYVLIEFWATWCPPCRRSIHLLNRLHERFGKELVVIGISDESESAVRKLAEPRIEYFSAIDTRARTKEELGVFGIPHVILLEPEGFVVWEGFPLLKDHELTEQLVEKILAVGRKAKAAPGAAPAGDG